MRGLYVHIPFCKSLCSFCDFPKRINQSEEVINEYLNKLYKDIDDIINKGLTFDTLYIGGGTPNSLNLAQLEELLAHLRKISFTPNFEATIEGNFELVTKEQAYLFNKYGINRISLGVQTLNEEIGKSINRISNYNLLKEKIQILKDNNITNINLDFIFNLPNETISDIKNDLAKIKELNVPHISFYSLILEDKSVLGVLARKKEIKLNEDIDNNMYHLVKESLKEIGYHHYEISNYAKKGYESKHNLIYWSQEEYIGLGMSAASLFKNKRIQNSKIIKDYLLDINKTIYQSDPGEYFWLGLRKIDGVSIGEFKRKYNIDPFERYEISKLIDKKLLEYHDDILKLTELGLDYGNYVCSFFI